MAYPIWKDYFVDLGADGPVSYRIRLDDSAGEIIYEGMAYLRPDADTIEVRINEICADYLAAVLPTLSLDRLTRLQLPMTFYIEYYDADEEDWVEADSVQFYNDWSYDPSFDVDTMGLAHPINGRIDSRQWLVYSEINADELTAKITLSDGTSFNVIVPIAISADFNDDFNADFARDTIAGGAATAVFDLKQWPDAVSVQIGLVTYEIVTDCGKYAVYYRNAYGGWDALLLEGTCKRSDRLTRYEAAREYDNRNPQNRGIFNYANEVIPVWELNTGILNDAAADKMHHLLESPDVYLYEIASDTMRPVIIEDTEVAYKAYKQNGHSPAQYTFTARLGRERVRR